MWVSLKNDILGMNKNSTHQHLFLDFRTFLVRERKAFKINNLCTESNNYQLMQKHRFLCKRRDKLFPVYFCTSVGNI